jgi:hypothetical protein
VTERSARVYRVIAEGHDALGTGLTLDEALAVLDFARNNRKRFVAIVNDETGGLVDESDARRLAARTTRPPPG